jgi:putative ABC transport system permease protein
VLGILKIAYKLLVNDKGKFAALLLGITFSVFLMIQMTSMFAGMMKKASATVTNTGAKVWVMDHAVTNVSSVIPMPDYMLDAVRSIEGVKFAVPLYSGGGLVRLKSGTSTTRACSDARSSSKERSRTSTPRTASSS